MSLKSSTTKRPPTTRQSLPEAEKAVAVANGFMIREYPLGVLGGKAQRLILNGKSVWIVPVFLTSPGYGPVGEVGLVAVDAKTHKIVASTPRPEVVKAGKRLREEKQDDLQAAFLQATVTNSTRRFDGLAAAQWNQIRGPKAIVAGDIN